MGALGDWRGAVHRVSVKPNGHDHQENAQSSNSASSAAESLRPERGYWDDHHDHPPLQSGSSNSGRDFAASATYIKQEEHQLDQHSLSHLTHLHFHPDLSLVEDLEFMGDLSPYLIKPPPTGRPPGKPTSGPTELYHLRAAAEPGRGPTRSSRRRSSASTREPNRLLLEATPPTTSGATGFHEMHGGAHHRHHRRHPERQGAVPSRPSGHHEDVRAADLYRHRGGDAASQLASSRRLAHRVSEKARRDRLATAIRRLEALLRQGADDGGGAGAEEVASAANTSSSKAEVVELAIRHIRRLREMGRGRGRGRAGSGPEGVAAGGEVEPGPVEGAVGGVDCE